MKNEVNSYLDSINKEIKKLNSAIGGSTSSTTDITKVGGATIPILGTISALPTMLLDASGNQITSFGSPSTNTPRYVIATNTTAGTITLSTSGLGLVSAQIKAILVVNSTLHTSQVLVQGSAGYTFEITGSVVSIYKNGVLLTTLTVNDSYLVQYEGIPIGSDITNDYLKVYEKSPLNYHMITHWSPNDGTVVYTSSSTLTCSNFPFTVDDASCFIASVTIQNATNVVTKYENGRNGISIYSTNDVITIIGATPFLVSDLKYRVAISANQQTVDKASDSEKVTTQNPLNLVNVIDSLQDGIPTFTCTAAATFNVTVVRGVVTAAAIVSGGTGYNVSLTGTLTIALDFNSGQGAVLNCTTNSSGVITAVASIKYGGYGYTASMNPVTGYLWEILPIDTGMSIDGFKGVSLSGKLAIASASNTCKVRLAATNDEDTAAAEWVMVTGANVDAGTMVKEISTQVVDLHYGLDFEVLNFKYFRVALIHELTMAASTVKMRRLY